METELVDMAQARRDANVARQIPGLEDLEDQEHGAGRIKSRDHWTDIVEMEKNEFDDYSSVFKPGAGSANLEDSPRG